MVPDLQELPLRVSPLPHRNALSRWLQQHPVKTVGAGLLAKRPCQALKVLAGTPHSRASPLPHWYALSQWLRQHPVKTVGAGLLAKRPCQALKVLAGTPHSRASPLPHWYALSQWLRQHPLKTVGAGLLAKRPVRLATLSFKPCRHCPRRAQKAPRDAGKRLFIRRAVPYRSSEKASYL